MIQDRKNKIRECAKMAKLIIYIYTKSLVKFTFITQKRNLQICNMVSKKRDTQPVKQILAITFVVYCTIQILRLAVGETNEREGNHQKRN